MASVFLSANLLKRPKSSNWFLSVPSVPSDPCSSPRPTAYGLRPTTYGLAGLRATIQSETASGKPGGYKLSLEIEGVPLGVDAMHVGVIGGIHVRKWGTLEPAGGIKKRATLSIWPRFLMNAYTQGAAEALNVKTVTSLAPKEQH